MSDHNTTTQIQCGMQAAIQLTGEAVAEGLGVCPSLAYELKELAERWVAYQASASIDFGPAEALIATNHVRRRHWLECFRQGVPPTPDNLRYERSYWNSHGTWEQQLWRNGYDFEGWRITKYCGDQFSLRMALPPESHFSAGVRSELSDLFDQLLETGGWTFSDAVELLHRGTPERSPDSRVRLIKVLQDD